MRAFRCAECGEPGEVDTISGPLPSKCRACDPEAWEHRQHARDRARAYQQANRDRLAAANARVAELEALLIEQRGALPAHLGEPNRFALGRAVRHVVAAKGHRETACRLRELAMVADAWAAILDVTPNSAASLDFHLVRAAA